jgi:hypothetical protein
MSVKIYLSILLVILTRSFCFCQKFYYEDTLQKIHLTVINKNKKCLKAKISVLYLVDSTNFEFIFLGNSKKGDYEIEEFNDLAYPLVEFVQNKVGNVAIEKNHNLFCRINLGFLKNNKVIRINHILNRLTIR